MLSALSLHVEECALRRKIEALEQKRRENRRANRGRLTRQLRDFGADGPPPELVEASAYDRARAIKLEAELDVVRLCLHRIISNEPVEKLRASLKAARNAIGEAILYEDEVRTYIRARNKKIGRILFWIDSIAGPEDVPLKDWGRGGEYVSPEVVAAAIERANEGRLVERVAWGTRPKDPEFAPDALERLAAELARRKGTASQPRFFKG